MNWICSVLLICSSFNPEMSYTNNDEFIEDITNKKLRKMELENYFFKPKKIVFFWGDDSDVSYFLISFMICLLVLLRILILILL